MQSGKPSDQTHILVLLRHGQSTWNLENRFTGWIDVPLTEAGRQEAHQAAQLLLQAGLTFDVAFTSVLKRAIHTLWIVLEEMGLEWIPVQRAWQLNERHYGALQGLNKAETAERLGQEQVKLWRRSYTARPPALAWDNPSHPRFDRRYASLSPNQWPATESLRDTCERLVPYWQHTLAPAIQAGQRVLISAHGNSMRALIKYLDEIPDAEIVDLYIPTGYPLVYELDGDLRPLKRYYLGDLSEVQAAVEAVIRQGKLKH
jgi:2,3-bisphosphoglycerate-dependent phosphoglycerate mutase